MGFICTSETSSFIRISKTYLKGFLKKPAKAHTSAGCPAFDVASQGKTVNKAKSNLGEALIAFFISCIERGVLDSVLKECGFKSAKKPSSARPRWTE
jgi:hypothetical protein